MEQQQEKQVLVISDKSLISVKTEEDAAEIHAVLFA